MRNASELVFASRGNERTVLHLTRCISRTTYVEANVTCISKGALGAATCGVGAIREMPDPPNTSNYSFLGTPSLGNNPLEYFMDILVDEQTGRPVSSATELYLADPRTGFMERPSAKIDLGNEVDIKTFEKRFSLLWNTLWKASWTSNSAMGGAMSNITGIGIHAGQRGQPYNVTTLNHTTSHEVFPLPPVYAIDRAWLALYFISVFVMLLAAVFALVMRALCRAPVLLGFVSSLIRESPYFNGPEIYQNSVEDGAQRSKRLGAMRVMVGDVGYDKEGPGKIAFVLESMGRRVEKGRWYD